jgi:MFS family permease
VEQVQTLWQHPLDGLRPAVCGGGAQLHRPAGAAHAEARSSGTLWLERDRLCQLAIWFQAGYGVAYVLFGRVIDRIGARAGYALAVGLWTFGHVLHACFTTTTGMLIARIPWPWARRGPSPPR